MRQRSVPVSSLQELVAVLRECHAALATVLKDEVLSAERTQQVAEAEIKLRAILSNPARVANLLKTDPTRYRRPWRRVGCTVAGTSEISSVTASVGIAHRLGCRLVCVVWPYA
jgi:NCAIR mutase (PurE)-related protein